MTTYRVTKGQLALALEIFNAKRAECDKLEMMVYAPHKTVLHCLMTIDGVEVGHYMSRKDMYETLYTMNRLDEIMSYRREAPPTHWVDNTPVGAIV